MHAVYQFTLEQPLGFIVIEKEHNDLDIVKKIIMSHEALFHLICHVNKKNFQIWVLEHSHEILQKPMHPSRITVWCHLFSGDIIGPYFFWKYGHTDTMITNIYGGSVSKA